MTKNCPSDNKKKSSLPIVVVKFVMIAIMPCRKTKDQLTVKYSV